MRGGAKESYDAMFRVDQDIPLHAHPPPGSATIRPMTPHPKVFSAELFALLRDHLAPGQLIHTLSTHQPNWIVSITETGLEVETEKTRGTGKSAQLVPAWMFEVAWQRLVTRGHLTNAELVSSKDLNVKRSSLVCAALASVPGVAVATKPIVLTDAR